ncbi:5-(carboxyamino)imidazole ribonucleotide synthase [Chitinispirillales bacterium ANBcel5]|uniref:5-(carboxyamino)imidazole ribonucleotide synthase n=1 Tax=Cellulosispirillum alkaliphilum TaxID=3039283 RepID=UPI002A508C15|nr:5-(carboxyamino)imidazole ribonucleotide synthase [Chitinispirillales bacterium ANBcel5]
MNIGILGGGQLARMLALAGHPLGANFTVLDPAKDACAKAVANHVVSAYDDRCGLKQFSELVDIVTYEFENIPAESVSFLKGEVPVYPSSDALAVSRDRLIEKSLFRELGIQTPDFVAINTADDLPGALKSIGFPAVLKSRTLGYDGKGQVVLNSTEDIENSFERLGSVPCILEAFVPFTREISVIAARSRNGETVFYPVSENTHKKGILHLSVCKTDDPMQSVAQEYCKSLLDKLNYVGVLALELFDAGGKLLANEIAPRVHNSGHWTIEGAQTSQFENHLRAVLGLPLGDASARGHCAMVNFVGHTADLEKVLKIPGAHLHNYQKKSRPGRKVGHATILTSSEDMFNTSLNELLALT